MATFPIKVRCHLWFLPQGNVWQIQTKLKLYPMKKLLTTLLLAIFAFTISAQGLDAYERQVFVSQSGDSLPYRLLRPEVIEPGQKYPLVLFMHGAGERGNDNERQLVHGSGQWLNPVNRERYPAYVLFPQCPEGAYWAYYERPDIHHPEALEAPDKPTPVLRTVMDLLQSYTAMPDVDASRVYIIGLSMGAMATYDLVIRFPEVFAAAVPICGIVNPERLANAKAVPFRIYHGDADDVVSTEGSRQAYRALKRAGADVTYFELPGVPHNSWNPAFCDRELLPWLFAQKRR